MATGTAALIDDLGAEVPGFDVAVHRVILDRVSAGELPECWRLFQPAPALVFGPGDLGNPGLSAAARAAVEHGYTPVVRITGGRPAVYDTGTLGFAHFVPDEQATENVMLHYEATASVLVGALRGLGVDARIGPVTGEYCPGRFSINARGAVKLAGLAQRLGRGGTMVGGVLVIDGIDRINAVLEQVYTALGYPLDPRTTGSVRDEVPDATLEAVRSAITARIAGSGPVDTLRLSPNLVAEALRLSAGYLVIADHPAANPGVLRS